MPGSVQDSRRNMGGTVMKIRVYREQDRDDVHALHAHAFDGLDEAGLVQALHDDGAAVLSLVAEEDGAVVGHILFTPLALDPAPADKKQLAALAPMAVLPDFQRRGVGEALARQGIDILCEQGWDGIVVLGHPAYYPRFGFTPASDFGITFPGTVPEEAFMALPLRDGGLDGCRGTVVYHAAFGLM